MQVDFFFAKSLDLFPNPKKKGGAPVEFQKKKCPKQRDEGMKGGMKLAFHGMIWKLLLCMVGKMKTLK